MTGTVYRQGYIPTQGNIVVRVRIAGLHGFLTLKSETTGIRRLEYEYSIPVSEANEIIDALCGESLIEKKRYKIEDAGQSWEVDVFLGAN